jgi:hypothetical protein
MVVAFILSYFKHMENAIFIAKIFGIIYLAIGLGIILNPGHLKKIMDSFIKSAGLMFIAGRFTVIL